IRSTLRSTSLIPKMEHQPKQRTATEQATMDFIPSTQTPAEREPDIDIPAVDSSFEDDEDMKESSRFTPDSEQIRSRGIFLPYRNQYKMKVHYKKHMLSPRCILSVNCKGHIS